MALNRPFSDLDWHLTPEPVRRYILYLEQALYDMQQRVESHEKRIEKLEVQTKKNSHNSSKPPSSDPPFSRKKRTQKKSKRAKGGQKGHEPHQQQVLDPTESFWLLPERCTCGHSTFDKKQMQPFYVHQHIELPEIEMAVSHFILQQCNCPNCGKTVKAKLPSEVSTGYGPHFTAFVGELSGIKAMSRNDVKQLCESVLQVRIATGTIQKLVDRTSEAIYPVYEQIGQVARSFWCNYIDETSWFRENDLNWLWVMVNEKVAFYRIDPHRSKAAFEQLVQDWEGILVSDGYGLYQKWITRQTFLAHLIRKADALAESKKVDLRRFGEVIAAWLRQLIQFANEPPTQSSGRIFIRSSCSPYPFGNPTRPMPANSHVRSLVKLTTFGYFSITKASTQRITGQNVPCALVCCGGNAAWAHKAKRGTGGWNGYCR